MPITTNIIIIIITAVLYSAKVIYSEVLPAQPWSINVVFTPEKNRHTAHWQQTQRN